MKEEGGEGARKSTRVGKEREKRQETRRMGMGEDHHCDCRPRRPHGGSDVMEDGGVGQFQYHE